MSLFDKIMDQSGGSGSKRSAADRKQDGARRLDAILKALDRKPGQSVLEIEPGKGWFTAVLLDLIVEDGTLLVQQPKALDAFFGQTAKRRIEKSKNDRAIYSDATWETLSAANESMDRVVWIQGPHEMWFRPSPNVSFGHPKRVFAEIARVLSPEGRLLIVDNIAPSHISAEAAGQLHRSDPTVLRQVAETVGLVLVDEQRDWITSSADLLDRPTHDPDIHLRTSQFLQIYQHC